MPRAVAEMERSCSTADAGRWLTTGEIPAGAMRYRGFNRWVERESFPRPERRYGFPCERLAYREQFEASAEELRRRLDY